MASMPDTAKDLLTRAVQLDSAQRYSEALICYEEAIQILIKVIPHCKSDLAKKELRTKVEGYLERAEKIKPLLKQQREGSLERVQCIQIKEGSKGNSYQSVFDKYLDGNVTEVEVLDPYIRVKHQVHNFVRFCELLVKSCKRLQKVHLTTGESDASQMSSLNMLQKSLSKDCNVELTIEYSGTLHDREIRINNGWIIKIGRGLDYFKKPENPFSIGFSDLDLRACLETSIEIFHRLNTVKT